eukprot:8096015-Pyramimonas_sp.AAC.1
MRIIDQTRPSEWGDDVMQLTQGGAREGSCSCPQLLSFVIAQSKTLARRFPAREERPKGWRTRPVDDETEGGQNKATFIPDRAKHDGIEELVTAVLHFLRHHAGPRLWKRDVSKACRR